MFNLYHGTLTANLPSILRYGLQPRGTTQESHDARINLPSLPEFVYLAELSKAANDCIRISENWYSCAPVSLIRINPTLLDHDRFYPDEDYIRLELEDYDLPTRPLHEQTTTVRQCRKEWRNSLNKRGTVAYRGVIPPNALTVCARPEYESVEIERRRYWGLEYDEYDHAPIVNKRVAEFLTVYFGEREEYNHQPQQ